MQLCRVRDSQNISRAGLVRGETIQILTRTLSEILHAPDPAAAAEAHVADVAPIPRSQATLLAPVDAQEIWAAGVTYKRSREARERESVGAARFYDLVYTAERPELFFKATAQRAVGPGERVRVRKDSRWSVPEPEVTLVIAPDLRIVGYTIGNDMSARDIEGENPLYLPQAKVYARSCALGPVITLASAMPSPEQTTIRLIIQRAGHLVFEGSTSVAAMARSFSDLVTWLGRDNHFPDGVLLLTGTGVVPPDDFTLNSGDVVQISIAGIGTLENPVE